MGKSFSIQSCADPAMGFLDFSDFAYCCICANKANIIATLLFICRVQK